MVDNAKEKRIAKLGGVVVEEGRETVNTQFWILLRVENGGDGDTEVGDWAPEIYVGWVSDSARACARGLGLSLRVEQK